MNVTSSPRRKRGSGLSARPWIPASAGMTGSRMVLLALALLALAACGRKGAPSPPGPPDQVTYPRVYPAY